jgi:predicted HTH transcriptional regulator
MPLPPFPSDEELMTLTYFPYAEGKQYEFKQAFNEYRQNINRSTAERIEQTICAFLNSDGGYIVCGIRDEDRAIIWMDLTPYQLDEILLKIDNIYHGKMIYTTDLEDITIHNIQTKVLEKGGKYLIIIKVEPYSDKEYRTYEYKWYRLNASNYAEKKEKFFRAKDISSLLNIEANKVRVRYTDNIKRLEEKIAILKSELNLEREETEHMLTRTILADKRAAEKKLQQEKRSCVLRINFDLILSCFGL